MSRVRAGGQRTLVEGSCGPAGCDPADNRVVASVAARFVLFLLPGCFHVPGLVTWLREQR